MSSNPTQPKFGDQGEGVNFPPEDDAEGHRFAASADGDQPEGFNARLAEGDGRSEGFKAMADSEDDTEGHRNLRPFDAGQPEGMEPVPSKDGFAARAEGDDTEGHRAYLYADGGEPQDGPEAARMTMVDDEDDTEGHRIVNAADGDDAGPESARRF